VQRLGIAAFFDIFCRFFSFAQEALLRLYGQKEAAKWTREIKQKYF
jgi:hypothetical protein